jgi:hypothetical protein
MLCTINLRCRKTYEEIKKKRREKNISERGKKRDYKRVFGSVVVVAFHITFHAEMYQNEVFSFFKNHF